MGCIITCIEYLVAVSGASISPQNFLNNYRLTLFVESIWREAAEHVFKGNGDETNMTAEVVITNQEESTVTETPTPTPSSDGGNSGGSENHSGGYGGGKSPKTGDDTPIGTYLMLLLAAAMLAAETERRRRRNKRQ